MEVMIVVAIIGILASIAIPSYTFAVRKGARADARAALMAAMQQQEKWFTQYGAYIGFAQGASQAGFKAYTGDSSVTAKYQLASVACTAAGTSASLQQCVQLNAVPSNGWADPQAGTIWLDSSGNRGCGGTDSTTCW